MKPGATAGVAADDHEQWGHVNMTLLLLLRLLLLLLLLMCFVPNLAVHMGHPNPLTLQHPYLQQKIECVSACACVCARVCATYSCACCIGTACMVWGSARDSSSHSAHAPQNRAASAAQKKHAS